MHEYGYAGLFGLLAAGIFGVPVPDETLLAAAGALVARGQFAWLPTLLCAFAGSLVGITGSYGVGRALAAGLTVRHGRLATRFAAALERMRPWWLRLGRWALVFGYFVPAVRHFTGIVAGSVALPFRRFIGPASVGAAAWVGTFVSVGFLLGRGWREAVELSQRNRWIGLGTALPVLIALLVVRVRRRRSSA